MPRAAAPGLLGLVLVVDAVLATRSWGLLATGLLDWAAHLATAGLVLLAVRRWAPSPGLPATVVLAASVLVDLDHVPLYAGVPGVEAAGGRPLTHSLGTLVLLIGAGLVLRRRRAVLLAVAAGVALHFLRDVATGPGLPLLWPADVAVRVPYLPYAVVLAALAVAAGTAPVAQPVGSSSRRRR